MKQAYEDARAGWYALASENCDEFSSALRSCEAYSITGGQGEEDYLVDISYRFQFRGEQRAEDQALDIEDWLDDKGWDIDLDEVKADGTSVEAKASGDEEDFRVDWLVSYSGIGTPSPLPTAVPEPESIGTTGTTTAIAAGQPGPAPTATSAGTTSSVSAGGYHTCMVRTDGSIACWGFDDRGQASPPAGSFSSVSAGGDHTCGVRTDGSIACWGFDDSGQASPPAGSFFSVSAGGIQHTCGVKTDGSIVCWGNDDYGQSSPPR